jgi:2-polyprenyl-3-methyl-5-hydroxy-6-metoxy-1,4-benzoquinol methylase
MAWSGNSSPEIGPRPLDTGSQPNPYAAAAEMRRVGMAMWSSAIIQAAGELRLADAIGDEPVSVEDLAAKTGADPDTLLRLLRALAAHGIFQSDVDGRYSHTQFSHTMRSDVPGSVLNLNLLGAAEWNWVIWSRLGDAVKTGEAIFPAHYGKGLYPYFEQDNPEAGSVFNRAMSESGQWTSAPVAEALDLSKATTVVDVGGGQGGLLRLLMEKNPHISGVLLDRPQVVGYADPALRDGGALASRATITATDIRESVPAAGDVYVLRQVMHIWDEKTCVAILRNCAEKALPGARIVLVEHIVNEGETRNSTYTTLVDLQMMLLGLGRERTEKEFADLMRQAGWQYDGLVPTSAPLHLVGGFLPD